MKEHLVELEREDKALCAAFLTRDVKQVELTKNRPVIDLSKPITGLGLPKKKSVCNRSYYVERQL